MGPRIGSLSAKIHTPYTYNTIHTYMQLRICQLLRRQAVKKDQPQKKPFFSHCIGGCGNVKWVINNKTQKIHLSLMAFESLMDRTWAETSTYHCATVIYN